jgi:hypothetical protein
MFWTLVRIASALFYSYDIKKQLNGYVNVYWQNVL